MGIGDWGLGIGDWGLGIGEWGLGPIPNPQSPIPNPHSSDRIIDFSNFYINYRRYLIIIFLEQINFKK